jgi:flagellar motility protein MotE (MotC chaperone)
MEFDFDTLESLRRNHPVWRLLMADHAALILAFLNRAFIAANERTIPAQRLAALLDDELYRLRQAKGEASFPRAAADYLDDWADDSRGWLRKYYPAGSDEAAFELSPAVEKAAAWIKTLGERQFVGTESRLRLVFELLREIVAGSQQDPEERIRELRRQQKEIDAQIARIRAGGLETMDDTATRERFQHMMVTARELLADFREVEQNFRNLDRATRERVARWEGGRGGLLADILGQRNLIDDSDQGKSFRAFWDFLMSAERQEELDGLLERALALPAVAGLQPDRRLRRIHHDWLEAGEHTQRTVALLSRQLRRFLDDQAWLENRRIMAIIGSIEQHALALRDADGALPSTWIDLPSADIALPMERPLYAPPPQIRIESAVAQTDEAELDAEALFGQVVVDRELLRQRIRHGLAERDQIRLRELLERWPLEQGLAELVAYLQLAADDRAAVIDDNETDTIRWDGRGARLARMPRVIFTRTHSEEQP